MYATAGTHVVCSSSFSSTFKFVNRLADKYNKMSSLYLNIDNKSLLGNKHYFQVYRHDLNDTYCHNTSWIIFCYFTHMIFLSRTLISHIRYLYWYWYEQDLINTKLYLAKWLEIFGPQCSIDGTRVWRKYNPGIYDEFIYLIYLNILVPKGK